MPKVVYAFILCMVFSGCGTSYHYFAPPSNTNSFSNKRETHISGNAGITGSALKFGYAVNNSTALVGTYHLSSPMGYMGSELETGIMLGKTDSSDAPSGNHIVLGCGFGNNYEKNPESVIKNFRGNYIKPFAMVTLGSAHKKESIGHFFFTDGGFSLKASYLVYDGYKATTSNNFPSEKKFSTRVFFVEPYFNFNIGVKWFRIDLGAGVILKKKYAFDKNLAVFPVEANAGILFLLGRKTIEKPQ